METSDKSIEGEHKNEQPIDISKKLTNDDIDRIEKYRQTKRTSVLAILFTDIVDFTCFTYEAGEAMSNKFRHVHDEIIIKQIKKDGFGEIIKQIGDSFLIVFSDPTLAVKSALKLQELFHLNAENLTYKGYTLKVRIGIHMGQVSIEEQVVADIFGIHVNMASRVLSLAKGGQVIVSGSVWENASGWLKDEKVIKASSIYYGKIKLKGINKFTDIYEFFAENLGKKGIPKPLLRQKHKKRFLLTSVVLLLVFVLVIIGYFTVYKSFISHSEKNNETRDQFFLANIISSKEDLKYLEGSPSCGSDMSNNKIYEIIEPTELNLINESYQALLKNNLISDFNIINEDDLRSEFAKNGKTLSLQLFGYYKPSSKPKITLKMDHKIIGKFYLGIIPHLYKIKGQGKYWLEIEFFGKATIDGANRFLSTTDSVPISIYEESREKISNIKRENYAHGKIVSIKGDNIIFTFNKNLKEPVKGLVFRAMRFYKPPQKGETENDYKNRRLKELEKAILYYGSIQEWIKKVDTNTAEFFSYREYRFLKYPDFKGPECVIVSWPGIEVRVVEVFDSTALAKVTYKKYPWMDLELGDEVELK
jgi:class 3 adenylate cyclase